MRTVAFLTLALAVTVQPTVALAYIGPGLGVGAIAAVFGVLAAIVMAFIALLWYPVKRLFGKGKRVPETHESTGPQ